MAHNSANDNVYNNYLTTYAILKSVSKCRAHKKSRFRGVYFFVHNFNSDAPLHYLEMILH